MTQGPPRPKLRLEKRKGKEVTVIAGLHTYGKQKLDELARQLKLKFGAGGTVKDGTIEIQGNRTEDIKAWFLEYYKKDKNA